MRLKTFDLGLIDFEEACLVQEDIFTEVKDGKYPCVLIFCRHYPVITLGRSSSRANILVHDSELEKRGIKVREADRGGDVTYHGPGQQMLYPILNLNLLKRDLHYALRNLEGVLIGALGELGLAANRVAGLTGVWLNDKKIASIGIAVRSWITYHGACVNVKSTDLDNFSLIRPCGMDIMMTSLESFLGREVGFDEIKQILTRRLEDDKSYSA